MIIQPRKTILLPCTTLVEMKGFFRFQLVNKYSGKCRVDTGFFPNKLLTSGMNEMVNQANWLTWVHVGTNSTPPTALDTQLLGFVAGSSTIESEAVAAQSSAPYYAYKRKTFRISNPAIANQNLSEAGVGWGSSGSTLISRALILDPQTQETTTVTPLPDEILDVTYEMRYYPPTADVTGPQVTLDGVTYDTTTRAAMVTDNSWGNNIGTSIAINNSALSANQAWTGDLGAITELPSGTAYNMDGLNATNAAYQNNSFERNMSVNIGAAGWNAAGGIRSVSVWTTAGRFQTRFGSNPGDNTIPKTNSYTMQLSWTISWAEKV
jgi:hypothetical protein